MHKPAAAAAAAVTASLLKRSTRPRGVLLGGTAAAAVAVAVAAAAAVTAGVRALGLTQDGQQGFEALTQRVRSKQLTGGGLQAWGARAGVGDGEAEAGDKKAGGRAKGRQQGVRS